MLGRGRSRIGAVMILCLAVTAAPPSAHATSARWAYEAAYVNVNGGDWYRTADNETATLAWGESYVMASLAAMFRATGDPLYLDRLFWHADGVLASRDDARGVADYRGVSGACWRNTSYQAGGEPYCYAVHTGMIAYPMAEAARLVRAHGLEAEVAPDGETYGDKATRYVEAAEAGAAFHDFEWDAAGYYAFPDEAFMGASAGRDQPLNQSNALGITLLVLHELTGDAGYLEKATALAARFRDQCTVAGDGALLWNYWGGAYSAAGEDISHAAINMEFARLAAEHGVVFGAADVEAMATTFVNRIYVDDATFADHVGGGAAVNGSSYRAQVGRWAPLSPVRSTIYAAVREVYDRDYPPGGVGSGSLLLGWAYLAEHEPPRCPHFFYLVDWEDQGAWCEATAYGANVLTIPPDLVAACLIPLEVSVPRATDVAQWDGDAYHRVASWQPTAGFVSRLVAYEPRWPHVYWMGGVNFQLEDTFVAGDGIQVMKPEAPALPVITSVPTTTASPGVPFTYAAEGAGDAPLAWSLRQFPTGARLDAASGAMTWTPAAPGPVDLVVVLENDWGRTEQAFTVTVEAPAGPDAGVDASLPDAAVTPDASRAVDAGDPGQHTSGGCACDSHAGGRGAGLLTLLLALLVLWRRRPNQVGARAGGGSGSSGRWRLDHRPRNRDGGSVRSG
jgi:hypothetical protein